MKHFRLGNLSESVRRLQIFRVSQFEWWIYVFQISLSRRAFWLILIKTKKNNIKLGHSKTKQFHLISFFILLCCWMLLLFSAILFISSFVSQFPVFRQICRFLAGGLVRVRLRVDPWRSLLRWTRYNHHKIRRRLCLLVGRVRTTCWISSTLDCITHHSTHHPSENFTISVFIFANCVIKIFAFHLLRHLFTGNRRSDVRWICSKAILSRLRDSTWTRQNSCRPLSVSADCNQLHVNEIIDVSEKIFKQVLHFCWTLVRDSKVTSNIKQESSRCLYGGKADCTRQHHCDGHRSDVHERYEQLW